MRVHPWGSVLVALGLFGCSVNNPTAPGIFNGEITSLQTNEANLIAAFNHENELLNKISSGTYSCGDPQSRIIKQYGKLHDPKIYVQNEYTNKSEKWVASVKLIQTYANTFGQIDTRLKADQATLAEIQSVYGAFVTAFDPAAAPLLAPLKSIENDLTAIVSAAEKIKYASDMQPALVKAVAFLETPSVLAEVTSTEQIAFNQWDSCAQETISYMRDLSDPAFAQKFGFRPAKGSAWRPVTVPATTAEILNLEDKYLTSRQAFTIDITFKAWKADLEAILSQNEKIIKGQVSPTAFQNLGSDICTAADAIAKADGSKKVVCAIPSASAAPGAAPTPSPTQTPA